MRPELALKEVEGAFCCSESVRATNRQRRIFSLGRCHDSDRGERSCEARSSRKKKWSRKFSAVLRACERPNVGDVCSPWGDVSPETEGKEAWRPEARAKRWSRESSAVLRVCERPNVGDVYSSWGDVTPVTEGNEAARPELALKEVVEGSICCSV